MSTMDASRFTLLADRVLDGFAKQLEDFDPDELDFATSDGVVTLEFADGTKFILNRQAGSHQMWYAAEVRAWHYDWDAEKDIWLDDRDGHELFTNLSKTVSAKLGREVEFRG